MEDQDPEDKNLITPATTPGSINNGPVSIAPNYHVPRLEKNNERWYHGLRPPFAIIMLSICQVIFFYLSTDRFTSRLRFEPDRQSEAWRFVSYMLAHESWQHLALNVFLQCLFAVFLESSQGFCRVLLVYLGGGIGGALGAACLRPDLLVGASAGVYALLISYLSYFILNFYSIKYRIWKCFGVALIVTCDVVYNVFHHYDRGSPTISWGAHAFGALVGFLLGLIVYTSSCENKTAHRAIVYTASILLVVAFVALSVVNSQLRKCGALSIHLRFHTMVLLASYVLILK